jgi:nitrogen fixation protein FixH
MTAKKNSYPLLILLLIGSFLCFSVWAAMRAVESGPEVTDADYYSKGLKYSSTVLEKRAADVLGWKVSTQLVDRTLEFHLHDKEGKPVKNARGAIFLFMPGSASSSRLSLHETEPGTYVFNLTTGMTGNMNARIEFDHKGARLNRQLLLNL